MKDLITIMIGILSIVGIVYFIVIAFDYEAERYFKYENQQQLGHYERKN